MNEMLRQALLRSGLTDEAVAAHLGVDPKTVRRWLDGRHPYPRLRSQLARLLAKDELELWPDMATGPGAIGRSSEVVAIYPRWSAVPGELWREMVTTATQQIGILASVGLPIDEADALVALLRPQAEAHVRIRIALTAPERARDPAVGKHPDDTAVTDATRDTIRLLQRLLEIPAAEIRLHGAVAYNSLLIADRDILVSQRIFGIAPAASPVLRLQGTEDDDLINSYLESFESIWQSATSLPTS
jgi:transcriptional regulator with XRE-family HTH domain